MLRSGLSDIIGVLSFSFLETLKISVKFKKNIFNTWRDDFSTREVTARNENSNTPGRLREPKSGPPKRTGRISAKAIPQD